MKRCFLLGVFLILGASPASPDSGWSESVRFSRFPDLEFRWRNIPAGRGDGWNLIEYEFRNVSMVRTKFFFVVGTDADEVVYGTIDLGAIESRLLGWYFEASSIVFAEATDPDSAGVLLDGLELYE